MDDFKQLGPNEFQSSHKFPYLVGLLNTHGKSIVDLMHHHETSNDDHSALAKLLNRPEGEIRQYFKALQNDLSIEPSKVDDLFEESDAITTGLPSVDLELGGVGGGIPLGEVTEVFGASGCGKSQFLYQLIHNCVMQYPESKPILVATETFMESKRLANMFEADALNSMDVDAKLNQISYIYCPDLESQDHILFTQLSTKLQQDKSTKLLVIDSIAHHFRREDAM